MRLLWLASLPLAFLVVWLLNYAGSWFYPGGLWLAQAPASQANFAINLTLLAGLMLLGILSSFVFERARDAHERGDFIASNFLGIFSDFRFVAAIFVSPIVFNSVYSLIQENPHGISDYLLAYQNGFFWQSVIVGVGAAGGAQPPPRRRRARNA